MTKVITITPHDTRDPSLRELVEALTAADSEIEVRYLMALSGAHWEGEIVKIVVDHGVGAITSLLVSTVAVWAKSWFKKRPKAKRVLLYGPNHETLLEVDREDPPAD
ncbi:MAG TPA: hypothetical protein VHO06_15825 [Polyangia bacterium]|nr:hypothetical protein [Polyangia bacterium]